MSINCFSYCFFCSRKAVSNCLMLCSGGRSTVGGGTGGKGAGGLKSHEMAGVVPAPGQDRGPALDAVALLGLFLTQLAAADFAHHGQFKGQTVVALTTPHTRLRGVLHDSFGKSVNT